MTLIGKLYMEMFNLQWLILFIIMTLLSNFLYRRISLYKVESPNTCLVLGNIWLVVVARIRKLIFCSTTCNKDQGWKLCNGWKNTKLELLLFSSFMGWNNVGYI